jgi:hypothetical protein
VLDLLYWWLGDLRVLAYRDDAQGGVEAEAECEFALAGGATVHLVISCLRSMRDTCIVECERGTVEIGIHEPALVRLLIGDAGSTLVGDVTDQAFRRAPLPTVFGRQLNDMVAAVRGTRSLLVGAADARRTVGIVEACYAMRQPLRRPWDYPEAYSDLRETSS